MEQLIIYVWGALALIMIVFEIISTGVLQIWFAIGAGCAVIVSYFHPEDYLLQIIVFFAVSGVLALIGSKLFSNHETSTNTGSKPNPNPVYSILNKTATVTKPIDTINGLGQISINGDTWSAKSKDDQIIPEHTKVKVVDIDGVKAVVEVID